MIGFFLILEFACASITVGSFDEAVPFCESGWVGERP